MYKDNKNVEETGFLVARKGYIKELMTRFAEANEDAIAFSVYDGQQIIDISYKQFVNDILKFTGYFKENKIEKQHIALLSPNSYEWIVTYFAINASGNVAVLLNQDLPEDILQWQCNKADVSVICGEEAFLSELQTEFANFSYIPFGNMKAMNPISMDMVYSTEPDETVIMMFTSGTTGKSKVVEITSNNLRYSIKNFEEPYTINGVDRILTPIPLFHILGFLHIIETLNYYKTVCLGRGVRYLFMDMAVLKPSMLNAVPSVLESLFKLLKINTTEKERQKYIGNRLQVITFGGAILKSTVSHFLMDLGLSLYVCYGMTEVSSAAAWGALDKAHSDTAGRFCEYIQYRFHDGELLLTGPTLMKGYYKEPEETAKVIEDGWLHTGDLGYCDENGFFYLTGRKKNVIILSNGENVNPEEIEEKFGTCEYILECVVYGDNKGICADVYTEHQELAMKFIKKYNMDIPKYRQVYKVNCFDKPLPKTGSGKIKRKETI